MLRLFKLNTGQDDHAVMFLDDYLKQVGLIVYTNSIFSNLKCRLYLRTIIFYRKLLCLGIEVVYVCILSVCLVRLLGDSSCRIAETGLK